MQPVAVGAFQLVEIVGQGGMGQVWRGVHRESGLPVAVKVVTAEKARESGFRSSFRREVQAVARLHHPGIVRVFDVGEIDARAERESAGLLVAGGPFLVMEWVPGGWLSPLWRPQSWSELVPLLLDVLGALAHAHARAVIHRDLKPENILVAGRTPAVRIKLSDFGLAHAMDYARSTAGEESARSTEIPMGTPAYMAPEQCRGLWRDYGTWTDLYSLGCVAFELACGRPPFAAASPLGLVTAQITEPVPRLTTPRFDVPAAFEGWIARLLRKNPPERFTRAADAAWSLRQLHGARPTRHVLGPPPPPLSAFTPTVAVASAWPGESAPTRSEPSGSTLPEADAPTADGEAGPDFPTATGTIASAPVASGVAPPDWRIAWQPEPVWDGAGGGLLRAEPVALPPDWRGGSEAESLAISAGVGLFGLRAIPFVGREPERDTIWRALAAVHESGSARAIVILGPAGVGKSRLAEWAVQRAHELGAAEVIKAVYGPRPSPGDGFGVALARYLRCVGMPRPKLVKRTQRLLRLTGSDEEIEWLAAAELMAPWTEADGDGPRLHFEDARQRLSAIATVLRRIGQWRPIALWLDDAQWGVEAMGLAHHLLSTRDQAPSRILVLLTCRQEALAERPQEAALLEQLLACPGTDRIELEALPRADHRALIQGLLQLEPTLADRLEARTAGNPMFVVQLIGDWLHRGALERTEHGFRLRPAEPAELPDSIHAVWIARIDQLLGEVADASGGEAAAAGERALELAAALGLHVSMEEWASAVAPAAPPRALLESLVTRRLAVLRDEQTWSFVHAMFRESVERRAREAGRWSELNARCAELLQPRSDSDDAVLAERLASHYAAAGDLSRATTALVEAGGARTRLGDARAGLALLAEGERRLRELDADPADPRWGQIRYWSASAFGYLGRRDEARALTRKVREDAKRLGWTQILADATRYLGYSEREAGRFDEARELCSEALALHESLGDLHGQARDLSALSEVCYFTGDLDEADRLAGQAGAIFGRIGKRFGVAACLRMRGAARLQRGELDTASELLHRALEVSESVGSRRGVAVCLSDLGELARARGDYAEAERRYRASVAVFQSLGQVEVVIPQANLALNLLRQGFFEEGAPMLRAVCHDAERLGRRALLGSLLPAMMLCAAHERDWQAWDELHARALEPLGQIETDTAWFAEEAGRRAAAAGHAERARAAWKLARSHWQRLGFADRVAAVQALLG